MNVGRIQNVAAVVEEQTLAVEPQPARAIRVASGVELVRPRPTLTSGGPMGTPMGLPPPGELTPGASAARIGAAIKGWTEAIAAEAAPDAVESTTPTTPAPGPDATARANILAVRISALKSATEALNEGNSPLGLQVLTEVTIPGLEAMLTQHRAALTDPQAAARELVMNTILGQTERLVQVMIDMRHNLPEDVLASRRALQEGGIPIGWASVELNNLVGAANRIAEASGRQPIGDAVEQLSQAITLYRTRLTTAVSLDRQRRGILAPSITDTEKLLQATRAQLSQARSLTATDVLNGQPTPESLIMAARAQADSMKTLLGSGDLEGAARARDAAKSAVQTVRVRVDAAKRKAEEQ